MLQVEVLLIANIYIFQLFINLLLIHNLLSVPSGIVRV